MPRLPTQPHKRGVTAPLRIIILTYESVFANRVLCSVLECDFIEPVAIIAGSGMIAGKTWTESLRYAAARSGPVFLARKAAEVGLARAAATAFRLARRPLAVPSLQVLAAAADVPLLGCQDARKPGWRTRIAKLDADLLVSANFNQRIPKGWLTASRLGAINLHGALLPRNRGLFPYFWALACGDREHGATVHWVDEELDTGDIIAQHPFGISGSDTMLSLEAEATRVGTDLLIKTLRKISNGDDTAVPQEESLATYNSWPTRADQSRFRAAGHTYGSVLKTWTHMQRHASRT